MRVSSLILASRTVAASTEQLPYRTEWDECAHYSNDRYSTARGATISRYDYYNTPNAICNPNSPAMKGNCLGTTTVLSGTCSNFKSNPWIEKHGYNTGMIYFELPTGTPPAGYDYPPLEDTGFCEISLWSQANCTGEIVDTVDIHHMKECKLINDEFAAEMPYVALSASMICGTDDSWQARHRNTWDDAGRPLVMPPPYPYFGEPKNHRCQHLRRRQRKRRIENVGVRDGLEVLGYFWDFGLCVRWLSVDFKVLSRSLLRVKTVENAKETQQQVHSSSVSFTGSVAYDSRS